MPDSAGCAVINAGPLVALALLERLDLLPALFTTFWIPRQVFHEVAIAGLGKPGASSIEPLREHVRTSPEPDPLLVVEHDRGEAEVITLARQLSPCLAVIDERKGRRIASEVYGLKVKGTAGLLVAAKRRGLLSEVRAPLSALRLNGYFIADQVVAAACQAAGEKY